MTANAAERALGFDHAGRDPSLLHVAVFPGFDPAVTVRTVEIIDSMQFVFVNDRRRAPVSPDYGRERLVLVEQLIVNIAPLPRRPGASIANRLESRGRL